MPPGAAKSGSEANLVDVSEGREQEHTEIDQPEVGPDREAHIKDEQEPKEGEDGEAKKEKPLPPEFETDFSETHKHLEFLFKHLSDFFLFTPSGRVDTTARKWRYTSKR